MEYCIEVDKNNKRIGKRPREDFYTGKYIHRSSHLIPTNSKGKILLQKRAKSLKWYPNLYTFSVSGTVADESYETCMIRETKEEIGLKLKPKKIFTQFFSGKNNKDWSQIFKATSNKKITPNSESSKTIWIKPEKLKEEIIKNPNKYTPPFIQGMKIYFKKYLG